ncbi:hypothetical protein FOZ61_002854 [Perkinsus olseni]|nr:hypothetical protein FOZ61_002854 [Perkinsus olseni]
MNDVDGCKHYQARATISDKIHFKSFKPFVPVRRMLYGTKSLPSDHPSVSTAKRLWKESQLFLTENEGSAPNGVYYGFNAAGTEVTIRFNENAQVEHVQGLEHTGFNELYYTMIGKAMRCVFYKYGGYYQARLFLEPVDPKKFNGSKESFPYARLNTVVGQPFNSNSLPQLLSLTETSKLDIVKSTLVRGVTRARNAASRFKRHGKDGLGNEIVVQDDTDERDPDDARDQTLGADATAEGGY